MTALDLLESIRNIADTLSGEPDEDVEEYRDELLRVERDIRYVAEALGFEL